jgi:hypothetical protein
LVSCDSCWFHIVLWCFYYVGSSWSMFCLYNVHYSLCSVIYWHILSYPTPTTHVPLLFFAFKCDCRSFYKFVGLFTSIVTEDPSNIYIIIYCLWYPIFFHVCIHGCSSTDYSDNLWNFLKILQNIHLKHFYFQKLCLQGECFIPPIE